MRMFSLHLDTLLLESEGPGEDVYLVRLQLVVLSRHPDRGHTVKTGVRREPDLPDKFH